MKKEKAEEITKLIISKNDEQCAITLKKKFGTVFDESLKPKEVIAAIRATGLTTDAYDMPFAYIVATMFYSNQKVGEDTIQECLRSIYRNPDTTQSTKKSIEVLLTTRTIGTKYIKILRRLSAKIKDRNINYTELIYDLSNWEKYDVYKKWANVILNNKED